MLLQASNNAPHFVEFGLQLVDLLLRDVLLRPGDPEQHEEERLLGVRLIQPFKPLLTTVRLFAMTAARMSLKHDCLISCDKLNFSAWGKFLSKG